MTYDNERATVPDWPSVEDPVCEDCGADAQEPCRPGCRCPYCLLKREQRTLPTTAGHVQPKGAA